jgi:hypothetical protein
LHEIEKEEVKKTANSLIERKWKEPDEVRAEDAS